MKIIPIKELRDTNKISDLVSSNNGPIFVTKNGYEDLVILSPNYYDSLITREQEVINKELPTIKESKNTYLRTSLVSLETKLGDINYNASKIKEAIEKAVEDKVDILSFDELTLEGNSLNDLYLSKDIISVSKSNLKDIINFTTNKNIIVNLGALLKDKNRLYDAIYTISNGKVLGITISNKKKGYFSTELASNNVRLFSKDVHIDYKNKFSCLDDKNFTFAVSTSIEDVLFNLNDYKDVNVILILSSVIDEIGVKENTLNSLLTISNSLKSSVEFISNGKNESSQDNLYLTKSYIIDEYKVRCENKEYEQETLTYDLDLELINKDKEDKNYLVSSSINRIYFNFEKSEKEGLKRKIERFPFINKENSKKETFEIIDMVAQSLVRRMKAIGTEKVVLGLSGGLDSTLAILIASRAMDMLKVSHKNIISITMPSFGTTSLTHSSAYKLASVVGSTYLDISIEEAVKIHLKDIKHDDEKFNNAYENAQARERTQILLDYANDNNALMIGTGDLSELCLGWATYAGDHISMYGLNASLPKTLIQEMTKVYGETYPEFKEVLNDILDTPISPELLPLKSKEIEQKTESFVGPYELNDFFIYHLLKDRFDLKKTYDLCNIAFKDKYDSHTIKVWLKRFVRRFFISQFKRSCLPEGIEVKGISVSPRTSLYIPSEIKMNTLLDEIEKF